MGAHLSFWLLLTIFFSHLSTNDGTIAYVKSSSNVTCPDQPCLILNDYAREQDQYFQDGTLFMFLSGVHQLNLRLHLVHISNVSLGVLEEHGSARILLSPMVNITCIDSNNITITGLEIFLSGQSESDDDALFFSALVFGNTTSFLSHLRLFGNDSLQSTAIRTHSSIVKLNDVIVLGATSLYGAALIAYNSTINFTGENYFMNNTATQGGAMSINNQSVANFNGNVSFINNTAIQGGAMTVSQSVANFHGNVSFVNNIASTSSFFPFPVGGAIYCESSYLSFSSSVLFQHNLVNGVGSFGIKGGGILAQSNSVLTFKTSSSAAFRENSAIFWGGAISISESVLILHGRAIFESNFATYGGGAIRVEENSTILCNSSQQRVVFRNNHADNETLTFGGAIFSQSSNLELEGILFERNTAGNGGAISSEGTGFLLHILNIDFHNNTASMSCGAVYLTRMKAVFDGINVFQWNLAGLSYANMNFSGESNSLSNDFVERGGAVCAIESTISLSGSQEFSFN